MKLRFDRGTILLADTASDVNLAAAPGVLWDRRVDAYRAPARKYAALKSWLEECGVQFLDLSPRPRSAQDAWSRVDLRSYQEAALSAWDLAHRRGVLALPTGSGKIRVALAAMQRTQLSALCLVPTRVLLEQWRQEIGRVYRGPIGCYGDGVRRVAVVTVATFEAAYRYMDELGDRFDLLIVDEVHHFGGGLRDEALEMAIADVRLGLTATPPRDGRAETRLGDLVGPTVFELAVADLAGGFLASFDAILLYLDLSGEERSAYTNRDSRALIFTADNDTAYAIAREHLIMPLTCDIGRQERADVLERFRRGELRALVSARVLNEGLDVPDADGSAGCSDRARASAPSPTSS